MVCFGNLRLKLEAKDNSILNLKSLDWVVFTLLPLDLWTYGPVKDNRCYVFTKHA